MWIRVDVYIRDAAVVVEAETPGRTPAELRVRATVRTLRIEADGKAHPRHPDARGYHRRERATGPFRREIPLPAAVEPGRGEARLRDGVLRVCLPLRRAGRVLRLVGGPRPDAGLASP